MTINDWLGLAWPLLAGCILGVLYFGGLWWTVRRATHSPQVALWFLASLLLRTALTIGGFCLVCGEDWSRWICALFGFSLARLLALRLGRSEQPVLDEKARHAP